MRILRQSFRAACLFNARSERVRNGAARSARSNLFLNHRSVIGFVKPAAVVVRFFIAELFAVNFLIACLFVFRCLTVISALNGFLYQLGIVSVFIVRHCHPPYKVLFCLNQAQ